jgi:hypothetical protein
MLIPSKHERLQKNPLILGADILRYIEGETFNIEDLFRNMSKKISIGIEEFHDTLLFLWCADLVEINEFEINAKENVSA